MLAHTKAKNVYAALVKAELTEYLRDSRDAFDLIVSADTLVYFGDLESMFAAAGALRPNGLFVFTLENAVGGELKPEISHVELRPEAGAPVEGLVIRATKSVTARRSVPLVGRPARPARCPIPGLGAAGWKGLSAAAHHVRAGDQSEDRESSSCSDSPPKSLSNARP
jgi:hypothetical protein